MSLGNTSLIYPMTMMKYFLDNMKSDDKEIFDTFIDKKSLTAIENWWKDDWYDFFGMMKIG